MSNRTDPACRGAFIAAMEAKGGYYLDWYAHGAELECWIFDSEVTMAAYDGFCLLWQPPRDVDPETVLGKLHAIQDAGPCTVTDAEATTGIYINIQPIIETIESLQRKRDEMCEALVEAADMSDHETDRTMIYNHCMQAADDAKAESLASKGETDD